MTGRAAYNASLALINERDSRGECREDILDYEKNAPELLNLIVSGLWSQDCLVRGMSVHSRCYPPEKISSLDDDLPLHEAVCTLVPYILASMLIREEDSSRAEYFDGLFRRAESTLKSAFARAERQCIRDIYSEEGR